MHLVCDHFEGSLCAGRETSPTSFLCRLTSVVPAPPAETANLMSWNYLGTLSKVTDYSRGGVSVGSPSYSVVVTIMPVHTALSTTALQWVVKLGHLGSLCQACVGCSGSPTFPYELASGCSFCTIGSCVLIGLMLNL